MRWVLSLGGIRVRVLGDRKGKGKGGEGGDMERVRVRIWCGRE